MKNSEIKQGDWIVSLENFIYRKKDDLFKAGPIKDVDYKTKYVYYIHDKCANPILLKEMGYDYDRISGKVDSFRKATKEEIYFHLLGLLENIGFTITTRFVAVRDHTADDVLYSKEYGKIGARFDYDMETDTLYTYGYGRYVLYEQGVWAELKNDLKLPTIKGYHGKYDPEHDVISYGCARIKGQHMINIYANMFEMMEFVGEQSNRFIKSITLSSDVTINDSQLFQIVNAIKGIRSEYFGKQIQSE